MTALAPPRLDPFRVLVLAALAATVAFASLDIFRLSQIQAAGADYSCLWGGAGASLNDPGRVYDFRHVSDLQGWPLGPHALRPYIYPPSALLIFVPFAVLPYWWGYGLWVLATGALFLWGGMKARGPWWLILLPTSVLVAYCGQVTFLIGGLVSAGLALRERRILAGVLLGAAAAVKPQLLVLAPLALIAEARWRTLVAAGATGFALCAASAAIWGPQVWLEWLAAVPRFQQQVIFSNPALVEDAVTPYAALAAHGLNGAWAYLLAPLAVGLVWRVFRSKAELPDRLIALFGATLLITPYAMNYELALFASPVAFYLSRVRDPRWVAYAVAVVAHLALPWTFWSLVPVLLLPLLRRADWRPWAQAWRPGFFKS